MSTILGITLIVIRWSGSRKSTMSFDRPKRSRGLTVYVKDDNVEKALRKFKKKVSDTGIGIPKKQFKTIFEPGFTTKKRGWGLGLSLTKRIVEEYHDGRIKVLNSEVNKGTTFQISFRKTK